ncbi:alcohol dehydrogenase catalytic domain-containing protein [Nocardioides sp. C4-1]|uniref:alcohol dehydrogenase catalytic domain-containing protein n=1 Tax=Nocardioides sp. C4-1 TaxID=3151851 RepID=UPI003265EE08
MKITGAVLRRDDSPSPYAESGPLEVVELDLDGPGPGELLVEMEAAGLCHSDLSVIDGNRPRPLPMLLGHEAAGRVVEVGAGVDDVRVGQRVALTFLPRCEDCRGCARGGTTPCERGSATNAAGTLMSGATRLSVAGEPVRHHLGVSAFATHAVVDRRSAVPLPDDVPPEVAAVLGCAVLTGGGAVLNSGRPDAGDTVVVVGLGGVGMAALLTALAVPDVRVVGVDLSEDKRAAALDLGAHEVLDAREAASSGVLGDVVVEAAGNAAAFETATALTGPGGRTVTVGLPGPSAVAEVSLAALVGTGRTIVGSYLGSGVPSRDVPLFADMWREGRLPVERLVTGEIALADVNVGMDRLASGVGLRHVVRFDPS